MYNAIVAQNSEIVVRSSFNDPNNLIGTTNGLQVRNGKNLFLVGGDISLDGGQLFAPGGRVELGGLREQGTIGLTDISSHVLTS